MKPKTFEEYLSEYIDFYKTVKVNGWDIEYMRKLIVRNLQAIKNKYLKEQKLKSLEEKNV